MTLVYTYAKAGLMEEVILVDEHDRPVGTMEKLLAHQQGKLHRAFSILVFNSKGDLMLQQRAPDKYHSGGLWTNTCCSHPRPGENVIEAGKRKLIQEMGFDCDLTYSHTFIYKAELDNNLTEHELDHVLIGYYDDEPILNKEEVSNWKFAELKTIQDDVVQNPNQYTQWFKIILFQPELTRLNAKRV
ncbi:MAG TPA: isopentenyl-diphosphate Delta-isomerase [Cyclobacteriaceae bacterium]|nr:isopentenyl-diphosphate Delta-isomerase [Cyclobacteriaceae bacterium]